MTFAACCKTNFDIVSIDVVIMLLLLLMIIGSVICVVCIHIIHLMLFVLLKAFAILIKRPLVVLQSFGRFFLLAMICSWSVALLCIQVDVRLSGWLDRVLQYSWFAIHVQVCWLRLLLLLLLLALVWGYLLYAVLSSICLLVHISKLSIPLSQRLSWSAASLVSILPGLVVSLVLKSFITVFI